MINLYSTSTIGSYTTGTVTCTKNSATVTGTGTTWSEIVNPGDILTLNDDKFYIISAVNSNTSLTLDKNFAENTATNVSYRILLNTAAHFPSDTAAKVERALEQLSDINEAAINNDRTVTAATKVNGKGLSSTMGDLHLNPASVNTNSGGTINFHYNQASSVTSSIYEDASGQIRINGVLELNEKLSSATGRVIIANGKHLYLQQNGTNRQDILAYTNNNVNNRTGLIAFTADQDGNHLLGISAINVVNGSTKWATLDLRADADGSTYISAPTPAATDNSTKIATTAFVNSRANNIENGTLTTTDLVSSNYSYIYKQNNVGYIFLSFNFSGTYTNWTRFHIFTSSILPKRYAMGLLHDQRGTQGGAYLDFETDGKIYLHITGGTLPSDNYNHGMIIFPC